MRNQCGRAMDKLMLVYRHWSAYFAKYDAKQQGIPACTTDSQAAKAFNEAAAKGDLSRINTNANDWRYWCMMCGGRAHHGRWFCMLCDQAVPTHLDRGGAYRRLQAQYEPLFGRLNINVFAANNEKRRGNRHPVTAWYTEMRHMHQKFKRKGYGRTGEFECLPILDRYYHPKPGRIYQYNMIAAGRVERDMRAMQYAAIAPPGSKVGPKGK